MADQTASSNNAARGTMESFDGEETKEEIRMDEPRSNDFLQIPSTEEFDLSYDDIDDSRFQPDCCGNQNDSYYDTGNQYILGTLIVRVVAARDLTPINNNGVVGLFHKGGSSNPYANVRFMNVAQRTSEVYNTIDPIWPRGETMYMDVTHAPVVLGEMNDDNLYVSSKAKSIDEPNAAHPGDPPKKATARAPATASIASSKPIGRPKRDPLEAPNDTEEEATPKIDPILTVAIFHAKDDARNSKFPNKQASGDSDDIFLGMASIDLTHVLTGKINQIDEWLKLTGTDSSRSSVRVVVEYEPSDAPPQPGDIVKFTDFCNPVDLFPATFNREYLVMEVDNNNVQISWTSPEGWVSSFLVHRCMLIVLHRHHNLVDTAADEFFSIRERFSHSPMVHVVNEAIHKVPDEGILAIGTEALQNGVGLLGRWWEGGLGTASQDLNFATNWDGRQNPDTSLDAEELDLDEAPVLDTAISEEEIKTALPNMPNCPITGEPMRDPVVAADGHTYERSAIARWFLESNKSPLTGSILPHKELVPNYMLLSSLQEAAVRLKDPPPSSVVEPPAPADTFEVTEEIVDMEEDVTDDVDIDD